MSAQFQDSSLKLISIQATTGKSSCTVCFFSYWFMLGERCWPVCHVFEPLVDNGGGDVLLQSPHTSDLPRQGNEHADVSSVWELKIIKKRLHNCCTSHLTFLWISAHVFPAEKLATLQGPSQNFEWLWDHQPVGCHTPVRGRQQPSSSPCWSSLVHAHLSFR